MSEEILKQLAELKGLVCSYRRDLDKQQQEMEGLKEVLSHPTKGILIPTGITFSRRRVAWSEQFFRGARSGSSRTGSWTS